MADVLSVMLTTLVLAGSAAFFLFLVIGIGCILFPPRLRQ